MNTTDSGSIFCRLSAVYQGKHIMNLKNQLLSFISHIFFPERCPLCGQIISWNRLCCLECKSHLEEEYLKQQSKLETISGFPLLSAFTYNGFAKQAVLKLKYNRKPEISKILAFYLEKRIKALELSSQIDFIIPSPMTKEKEEVRGYNQAERIAYELSVWLKVPILNDCLIKSHETAEQHTLPQEERKYNLSGSFSVNCPEKISGKQILLVDDIATTGNTFAEASRLLYYWGAEKVYAAAACRVCSDSKESY